MGHMRNLIALFIGAALLSSCVREQGNCPVDDVTRSITFYSKQLERDKRLILETSCVEYDGCIETVQLCYLSHALLDIPKAREMIVDVANGVLKALNENELIRPELCHLPLSVEDLYIIINFDSYYGEYIDLSYTNHIILKEGQLHYYSFDAYNHNKETWHRHCESFEIAEVQVEVARNFDKPYYEDQINTGFRPKPVSQYLIAPFDYRSF